GPRKEFAAPGSDRRWGSGGASVERISFADAGGRGKHVFATGEEVRVRLEFRVDREGLAPARLIVAIHRSDGVTVMETRSGPVTHAGTGARAADLVFPKIELLAGTYYFDVGLAPGEGGADPYDFVKNCGSIRVYQDSKSVYHDATGICALAHDWRVG
ncbi:MAG: Wzt carbohydrate-binding domain-containing protein, partial [Planctomycetota bacterium]